MFYLDSVDTSDDRLFKIVIDNPLLILAFIFIVQRYLQLKPYNYYKYRNDMIQPYDIIIFLFSKLIPKS